MTDWRKNALAALDDARKEVERAAEPTIVVILTVGSADLLKEQPISVYANQNWTWLRRVLAFAAWRFSLKDDGDPDDNLGFRSPASHPSQITGEQ
jgi:hypothetical protein